ncbi:MAG TPA: alpha/beta fold hydrolase [Bacteroidia bacterium]|jgi:esterase/lipase|nr:alpha/beta fold hydrolase [Bacteroidia bacterium]
MRSIILLHGAIGSKDQLEPLAKELSSHGYQTYSLNFSGHGQTPFQNQFSIPQFADELKLFIEKNNLDKPNVFGYSMGGYVALYLASEQNILGNIITLGTKFEWSPEISAKEIKMLDAKKILEKVPGFAEALQKRHGNNWQLLLQRTAEMMTDLGNNNLLNRNSFSKIKNKVLIGLADGDTMVSVEETDNAASKIIAAKRYTLQNTKHPIETVKLVVLANVVKQFIP